MPILRTGEFKSAFAIYCANYWIIRPHPYNRNAPICRAQQKSWHTNDCSHSKLQTHTLAIASYLRSVIFHVCHARQFTVGATGIQANSNATATATNINDEYKATCERDAGSEAFPCSC